MRGLTTRAMDDSGVSLVTKRSYLTPKLTTAWYPEHEPKAPEPTPPGARRKRAWSWPRPELPAVQHASRDEVFLTGPQGNLFPVDE